MKRFFRNNGLTIVMFSLFLVALVGQFFTGYNEYNNERNDHQQPSVSYETYLGSGHFIEAVFENWESEFLQMGTYVLLTVFLFQKGSPESKDPDKKQSNQGKPSYDSLDAPWPVRRGGLLLKIYENSLTLALFSLFFLSLLLHAAGGSRDYCENQMTHGGECVSLLGYLGTSRFWFESFQNFQSEFLSIAMLVVLAIFLRQKGSPESKPVASTRSSNDEDD